MVDVHKLNPLSLGLGKVGLSRYLDVREIGNFHFVFVKCGEQGGWMDDKVVLRIAHSNQKQTFYFASAKINFQHAYLR